MLSRDQIAKMTDEQIEGLMRDLDSMIAKADNDLETETDEDEINYIFNAIASMTREYNQLFEFLEGDEEESDF